MSTNGNIYKYFIKLLVRGFDKAFIYEVGMEEIERLQSLLAEQLQPSEENKSPHLFMFNAVNDLVVGVSPTEIQLAHFLFEKGSDQYLDEENGDPDPERRQIHLYLQGRTEPYKISLAEYGDAAVLYFRLEAGTFERSEFYSLLDIDGEEVAVRLQDVILIEFQKDVLNEGIEESGAGKVDPVG